MTRIGDVLRRRETAPGSAAGPRAGSRLPEVLRGARASATQKTRKARKATPALTKKTPALTKKAPGKSAPGKPAPGKKTSGKPAPGLAARWSAARDRRERDRRDRDRSGGRDRARDRADRLAGTAARPPLRGLTRALVMLLAFGCMVVFAVLLAKVTLVPSPASVSMVHANFHPGSSIRAYFDQPDWRITLKEVGGNVLLGLPFGLLLPVLFPRTRGLVRVVLTTAFVMLCVETVQGTMVEGRAFDIDDVILNTAGALLGYVLIGWKLGRSVHPRRTHWWHRRPART